LLSVRSLVATENMTLDGVIGLEGGWFRLLVWSDAVDTSDIEASLREHMQAAEGRHDRRHHLPQPGAEVRPMVDARGSAMGNTTIVQGDIGAQVRALKEQPGGEIGVTGSSSTNPDLISAQTTPMRPVVTDISHGPDRRWPTAS
jgi:hypothetical protein